MKIHRKIEWACCWMLALSGVVYTLPAQSQVPLGQVKTSTNQWMPNKVVGAYAAINNPWGSAGIAENWALSVGMVRSDAQKSSAVDVRFFWKYPEKYPGKDVLAYPQVAFGQAHGFSGSTTGALPVRVADAYAIRSRYSAVKGHATGAGQLAYDLWITSAPGDPAHSKVAEIMLPTLSYGGYGIPDSPKAAAAGRKGPKGGRSPGMYQGREVIDGRTYDVYHGRAKSASWPLPWDFIVFQPVEMPDREAVAVHWGPLLKFLVGKGWIQERQFLNSVELGVEVINSDGGTAGDLEVTGFQVEP